MKMVRLVRQAYLPMGAFGVIVADGLTAATVEKPWVDNAPFISCIPEGEYRCEKVISPRHGVTYEVMDVPGRTSILFHVANFPSDLQGCIGLGEKVTGIGSQIGVTRSEETIRRFKDFIHGASFRLLVSQYRPSLVEATEQGKRGSW